MTTVAPINVDKEDLECVILVDFENIRLGWFNLFNRTFYFEHLIWLCNQVAYRFHPILSALIQGTEENAHLSRWYLAQNASPSRRIKIHSLMTFMSDPSELWKLRQDMLHRQVDILPPDEFKRAVVKEYLDVQSLECIHRSLVALSQRCRESRMRGKAEKSENVLSSSSRAAGNTNVAVEVKGRGDVLSMDAVSADNSVITLSDTEDDVDDISTLSYISRKYHPYQNPLSFPYNRPPLVSPPSSNPSNDSFTCGISPDSNQIHRSSAQLTTNEKVMYKVPPSYSMNTGVHVSVRDEKKSIPARSTPYSVRTEAQPADEKLIQTAKYLFDDVVVKLYGYKKKSKHSATVQRCCDVAVGSAATKVCFMPNVDLIILFSADSDFEEAARECLSSEDCGGVIKFAKHVCVLGFGDAMPTDKRQLARHQKRTPINADVAAMSQCEYFIIEEDFPEIVEYGLKFPKEAELSIESLPPEIASCFSGDLSIQTEGVAECNSSDDDVQIIQCVQWSQEENIL